MNSPCFKLRRFYSISVNLSNIGDIISGVESERTGSKFTKRKRKFLCCVHLLYKVGAWNYEVSCRRRATTARKCTKKREARAKLLFCQFKPIAFCRSRCCRHRRCLSSLLSKHFATMVTWRNTSLLLSSSIWVLIEVLELNFYVYRFP